MGKFFFFYISLAENIFISIDFQVGKALRFVSNSNAAIPFITFVAIEALAFS